jgi:hypothetical protein
MVLDEFVYNPSSGVKKISAHLVQGGFQVIVGERATKHSDVQVKAEASTITGDPGADLYVSIDARSHSVMVDLQQGSATVTAEKNAKTTQLKAGHQTTVSSAGQVSTSHLKASGWSSVLKSLV